MKKFDTKFVGGYRVKDFEADMKAIELEEKGVNTGRFTKSLWVIPAKPKEVRSIRKVLKSTQLQFANIVGVSVDTVKAWEAGRRQPEGPASKLMRLLKKHTALAQELSPR